MSGADVTRRLVRSGLVLVVLLVALGILGWAWVTMRASSAAFADREVVDGNHLGAGTIDVALGDGTVLFAARNMAAGDAANGQLELVNRGTFPFRYRVSVATDGGPLGDVLELVAWRGTSACAAEPGPGTPVWRPALRGVPGAGQPVDVEGSVETGRLAPEESQLICLRADLPLSAPNRLQREWLEIRFVVDAEHDVEVTP